MRNPFGNAIRARRKELGLTINQVASACTLSPPYLSELERGVKVAGSPGSWILPLSAILQTDLGELRRLAILSQRSIPLDLEGASLPARELAFRLARLYHDGMPETLARFLLLDLDRRLGIKE